MAGYVALNTRNLQEMRTFYQARLGMMVWLEQVEGVILNHGNLLLGFYEREDAETQEPITVFYETVEDVDAVYQTLADHALEEPQLNEARGFYHFFARDPEGRLLEFRALLHPRHPYLAGEELLIGRRSIHVFEDEPVPDEVLWKLFEICRYAPSSMNRQPWSFIVIRSREKIEFLAGLRKENSAPIANAPMAVTICADPRITKRPEQDGCIAAYHFMLAAKLFGLGTCWIAAMDRDEVKDALGISRDLYVATITPLGYPAERPEAKSRKDVESMVRFID
jgi:nitroreductase/catechol 2,3-dioxygenase-like lactoylglutathione lyase family enzyme